MDGLASFIPSNKGSVAHCYLTSNFMTCNKVEIKKDLG